MSSSEDHDRLSSIFLEASDLENDERERYLDRVCGAGTALRARVVELLRHDSATHRILEPGAVASRALELDAQPVSLGPYRVLQVLSEGGMGIVYRAEQRHPIRREVAIKLIKLGIETKQVIARFESERQALALMNHPNIARVIDAGTSDQGRPYFAMEFVDGESITGYCDRERLGVRERLELFLQVSDGVQHAHQKAIIHRDLKPSNVLVETEDGRPVPKIIDFGIAKAMDRQLTEHTLHTEAGQLFGTPEYMSPEQAEMSGRNIDTRTDVYALGAMLYELLTGVPPFDTKLGEVGIDEIRRMIREDEPQRPSVRVSGLGPDSTLRRGAQPANLARRLRGDLDWITLKALEKSPARRYGSPSELAADIERHLRDEPVLASPPSRIYRARKFVGKHRAGVGFMTALLVFLIGFGVTMAVLAGRIADERDRANAEARRSGNEAQTAMQVTEVLVRMLQMMDVNRARGQSWSVPELLFWAENALEFALQDQPVVRARVMLILGQIYENIGDKKGLEMMRVALGDLEVALGKDHALDLKTLHQLAARDGRLGHFAEAELLLRHVVTVYARDLGDDHPRTLEARTDMARVFLHQNRVEEAKALLLDVLDRSRGRLGAEDPQTLETAGILGAVLLYDGRPEEARSLLAESLEPLERRLGPYHQSTLACLYDLARVSVAIGDTERALGYLRQTIDRGVMYLHLVEKPGAGFAHGRTGMLLDPFLEPLHGTAEFERIVGQESWGAALVLAEERVREGDLDGALRFLELAVERGCALRHKLTSNPRLLALHGDPVFEAIVAKLPAVKR